MAKFTVYFKDKAIQSQTLDSGVVHIGRDETNDLVINSLTVAPAHAVAILKEGNCIIKQLNDEFPLIVNNKKNKEAILENDDRIEVGKHIIVFNTAESVIFSVTESMSPTQSNNKEAIFSNGEQKEKTPLPVANLQVMDGQFVGRVLPLNKPMTRFGNNGSGVVVLSRRKEGYCISALKGNPHITINKELLADKTIHLNNNDILVIDGVSMQFFFED